MQRRKHPNPAEFPPGTMAEILRLAPSPEGILRTHLRDLTGQECDYWGRYMRQLGKQHGYAFTKEPWPANRAQLVFRWHRA
jgi:hypothetical protein